MYRWFGIHLGRDKRDGDIWLKLGPVTFVLFYWFDGTPHFEMHALNHLLFRVPAIR
jgi:hypothetical protein